MEIKIGIQNIGRELSIECDQPAQEIADSLAEALNTGGIFTLTDERGRKLLVPAAGIGYLDIGEEHHRQVGFFSVSEQ